MAAGDKITEGMRILAALAAVAQDPTLLSALKAGPGLRDSLKKIATNPPAGFPRLAEDLAQSSARTFAELPEKPRDADVLFLQMVEAGLPDPARIMAEGMDAEAIVEGMLTRLTEREHCAPEMQALFRRITTPVLRNLLADNAFADAMRAAFMQEVLTRLGDLSARLERVDRLTRLEMMALGDRFEIVGMHALSDAELREALELRATDYRRFREQIEAIDERTRGLGTLKAARDALARLDFAEVETLLSGGEDVETEIAPETKVLRADNALLRGRAEEAFVLLSAAADSFSDPEERAWRRLAYQERLHDHGERYEGQGLVLTARMLDATLETLWRSGDANAWAGVQTNRGQALETYGNRLGGAEGARMLGEAAEAYRAVLRIWDEATSPERWAMTQRSLGSVLLQRGELLDGPEALALLEQAAGAHRAAMRVWTKAKAPVTWAVEQRNLGLAMCAQGKLLRGSEGVALLMQTAEAYGDTLQIWIEAGWELAWASAVEDLALIWESIADNDAADGQHGDLLKAAELIEAASRAFHRGNMPWRHARAAAALARVRAKLAALPDPA